MGLCSSTIEFQRKPMNFLIVKQEVEVCIKKRSGRKVLKEVLKFALNPAYSQVFLETTQDFYKIKLSGVVLPGQDPHNKILKDCQDQFFTIEINDFLLIGLFDGHGKEGKAVVNFCVEFMKAYIYSNFPKCILDTVGFITEIITVCDLKLREGSDIDCSTSGTTAIILILHNNTIHVGSVGDSRAVLGSIPNESLPHIQVLPSNPYKKQFDIGKTIESIVLTVDQKPEHEEEKERILQSGGKIRKLTDMIGQFVGPFRVFNNNGGVPGLAMSRSIGDSIGKKIGVISTPIVKSFSLRPGTDLFIVIASDGIWDVLDNYELVEYIENFRYKCKGIEPKREIDVLII